MSNATPPQLVTTEQLLAMPEDGIDRELIRGVVKENEMTRRNPWHASVETNVATLLRNWVKSRPRPRGRVYSGEIGTRLRRSPDTTVGIDVAYFSADTVLANAKSRSLIDGPPILAVEILSPSDKLEDIWDKVAEYLDAGVAVVWVIDPVFKTVTVNQQNQSAVTLDSNQELTAEPHLPGFTTPVSAVFED